MTIREEFDKAFEEYLDSVPKSQRFYMESALWGAKWMAERLELEARKEVVMNYEDIRKFVKEL